jgi:hypothetical protein
MESRLSLTFSPLILILQSSMRITRDHLSSTTPSQRRPPCMDDAVAAPVLKDHLAMDDALAARISCRAQRPPLDVDGAIATPTTISSPSSGLAPQPATSGIAPPTASTLHRRPPPHIESATPPSSPRIDEALMPIVGATSSQRRSSSSSHNSLRISLKNTHHGKTRKRTHTRTHVPRKTNGFAKDTPL